MGEKSLIDFVHSTGFTKTQLRTITCDLMKTHKSMGTITVTEKSKGLPIISFSPINVGKELLENPIGKWFLMTMEKNYKVTWEDEETGKLVKEALKAVQDKGLKND